MEAAAKSTQEQQKGPKGGHLLTAEDRRKGQRKAAAAKRERSKGVRQRLAEKAQDETERIASVFIEAMEAEVPLTLITQKDGTVIEKGGGPDHPTRIRAAVGFVEQAFGRPPYSAIVPNPDGVIEYDFSGLTTEELDQACEVLARAVAERGRTGLAAGKG